MNAEVLILSSLAYKHWVKPRLLPASAPKCGKALLLHLCARARFVIPMIIVITFCVNRMYGVRTVFPAAEEEVQPPQQQQWDAPEDDGGPRQERDQYPVEDDLISV